MIIKHKAVKTETTKDAKGKETQKTTETISDISQIVMRITWSGSRLQASRKLEFTYAQDSRDPNLPYYVINNGEIVYGYDEAGTLRFQGRVYDVKKSTRDSQVTVRVYDDAFILNKSKTTEKFTDLTAEDITKQVCNKMGVSVGNLAKTGKKLTFIASEKTGYQIIMMAYTEAAKKINAEKKKDDPDVKYQVVMNGEKLDVVIKGTLIDGFTADQYVNTESSDFEESIENMVNSVRIDDQQGNQTGTQNNDDDIKKYGVTIQDIYKSNPNDNAQEQIKDILKKPERSGGLELLGDYRVISSYSIAITDMLTELTGKFWVKSDTHTFVNGMHFMRLEIEFENIMNEQKLDKEKAKAAAGKGSLNAVQGLAAGYSAWGGQTMEHGDEGCVEAVGKIGSYHSPFLAQECNAGVAGVDQLIGDATQAGIEVQDYTGQAIEPGDTIVYGRYDRSSTEHVVLCNTDGGYTGNSSGAHHTVWISGDGSNSYYEGAMGSNFYVSKIIKTSRG